MPGRITFRNGKGDRLHIPKDRKLIDLIEMGVTEIKFEGKWSFLPNGWYSVEKTTTTKKKGKQT